jgi:DNA-binding IclR family transcriptional regulator
MLDTGLTVHLAVMEEGEVILIDRIEAAGVPHLATWVGKRMGLHCTALGKALIAGLPMSVLDELIRKHGLIRHNDNTIAFSSLAKESSKKATRSMMKKRRLEFAVLQRPYATGPVKLWRQ